MTTTAGEAVTKRLHIAGLTPAIKPEDLAERFSRYGVVEGVENVGVDGLGQPRTFAFLTIKTTQQNLTKCLNTMQGSMWRGAKLKIGEAKTKWDKRLEVERNPSLAPPLNEKQLHKLTLKKRKAKKMALAKCNGTQLADMKPIGAGVLGKRKHWKLTDEGTLLRPIYTRPTHPLTTPTTLPDISSSTAPLPLTRRHKPSTKRGRPMLIRRAKRAYLDPTRWGARHLTDEDLVTSDEGEQFRDGNWTWIPVNDVEKEVDIEGRWEYKQGEVVKFVEEVKNKRRRVEDVLNAIPMRDRVFVDEVVVRAKGVVEEERDEEMELSDMDDDDELWGGLPAPDVGEDADNALFPVRKEQVPPRKKAVIIAPKLKQLEPLVVDQIEVEEDSVSTTSDDTDDLFANVPVIDVPGSPLFGSRSPLAISSALPIEASMAPFSPLSSFASATSSQDGDSSSDFEFVGAIPPPPGEVGFAEFVQNERQKGLEVLKSFGIDAGASEAEEVITAEDTLASPIINVSTSPALPTTVSPAMVKGAAAGETSSGSDKSGSASSSSDEDGSHGDAPPSGEKQTTAPNDSAGASGGSGGSGDDSTDEDNEDGGDSETSGSESDSDDSDSDSEDEDEDMEKGSSERPGPAKVSTLKDMFAGQQSGEAGFSLLSGLDVELDTEMAPIGQAAPARSRAYHEAAPEPLPVLAPLNQTKSSFNPDGSIPLFFPVPKIAEASGSRGRGAPSLLDEMQGEGFKGFWKQETDEQMTEAWNKDKLELTREYKKRHREAVKRRKRGRMDLLDDE